MSEQYNWDTPARPDSPSKIPRRHRDNPNLSLEGLSRWCRDNRHAGCRTNGGSSRGPEREHRLPKRPVTEPVPILVKMATWGRRNRSAAGRSREGNYGEY